MKPGGAPPGQWLQLSEWIARTMGLHFPRERWGDLQRGLAGAAQEFGFDDIAACIDWLMGAPPTPARLQVLAGHLTIGETYFFRDPHTLAALATSILPELIQARRGGEQRLRIWSAACCTGEEPYSLAILLHEALPDLSDWQVTITATDINARALHKAAVGVYGEWSFRDAPAGLKERYFKRTADGRYAIVPWIRKLVDFSYLNLVEGAYPSLATGTNAMDLIVCRNVLMYFAPPQAAKVIGNLRRTLVDGGWLVVSPSEASHVLFPEFVTADFPGAIFYRKSDAAPGTQRRWVPEVLSEAGEYAAPLAEPPVAWTPPIIAALPNEPPPTADAVAGLLYRQGRYAQAANTLMDSFARHAPGPAAFSLLARALANLGRLAEALAWCDRWVAADKMDPAGHYLRAVVLLEQGDPGQARACLQRTLYLQPEFVLAHFALGNLARSRGKSVEAHKHFANALQLLRGQPPDDLLPESDGMSARQLTETVASLLEVEALP